MANDLIKIKDFPILDEPEDINLEDRVVATHSDGSSRQSVGITVAALGEKFNSDAQGSSLIPRNLFGTDEPSSDVGNNNDLYFRTQTTDNTTIIIASYIKINGTWVSFQVTDDNWRKFLEGQGFDLISYDLTSVKAHAFENNQEINSVIIPNCTHIYEYAFHESSVSSLYFPKLVYIGDYALCDLSELSGTIDISSVEEIGEYGFAGPNTPYSSVPDYTLNGDFSNLVTIGDYAFFQNYAKFFVEHSAVEKVLTLPKAETIGERAFGATYSQLVKVFDKIYLPSIVSLSTQAFRRLARNLTDEGRYLEFHIGPNCESIGNYIFYDSSLSTFIIYCEAVNPPTLSGRFDYSYSTTNPYRIYVPESSVQAYKEASGWSVYADVIEAIPEEE